jgi:hypothetical protein
VTVSTLMMLGFCSVSFAVIFSLSG